MILGLSFLLKLMYIFTEILDQWLHEEQTRNLIIMQLKNVVQEPCLKAQIFRRVKSKVLPASTGKKR